ncbi:MAG TPA: FAD-dependent oxidoreductase [Ohtaekwangia sp.]
MTNTFAPSTKNQSTEKTFPFFSKRDHIVIIGAGAFGGWTALHLLRAGFNVTLIDAWGAGNARSSSGDETRVIRSTYGNNEIYFDLNVRALELWKENENLFAKKVFHNTGVLWLCYQENTPILDDSIPFARKHNQEYIFLSKTELDKRYSQLNTADIHHAYFDPNGGYLMAREATQAVSEAFRKEGGNYIQASVSPGKCHHGKMESITLSTGESITGDAFIFACGSWLGTLFPEVLQNVITCSRQEVYYFGVPEHRAAAYDNFPVWIDVDGKDFYYGIAGNVTRGFKVGVDIRGAAFDPSNGDRTLDPGVLKKARTFLGHRFPELKDAPLLENRVCPYENSPDGNFLFDKHPEAENVLFLGGGSGHGFKHGPALGELVSKVLSGEGKVPAIFCHHY